jgi:hypothetical protein
MGEADRGLEARHGALGIFALVIDRAALEEGALPAP